MVQIRYEGDDDLVQAELMAFTIKSSACAFDICLAENDEEDTVEADKIIVEDNYQTFTNFVNRVNACIAQFDQELRGKQKNGYRNPQFFFHFLIKNLKKKIFFKTKQLWSIMNCIAFGSQQELLIS